MFKNRTSGQDNRRKGERRRFFSRTLIIVLATFALLQISGLAYWTFVVRNEGNIIATGSSVTKYGSLSFSKTVEGKLIASWLFEKYPENEQSTILKSVSFDLYASSEYPNGEVFKTVTLSGSQIDFGDDIPEGYYYIVENLEEPAASVFKQHDDMPVAVVEGGVFGLGETFDTDADYWVYNSWGASSGSYILETKFKNGHVWTFKNDDGNPNAVLDIRVRNSTGSVYKKYISFCGSHGSLTFGESVPYKAYDGVEGLSREVKDDLCKALNYIFDIYGSIDGWQEDAGNGYKRPITAEGSTYAIAQAVAWMIIHSDTVESIAVISNNHGYELGYRYDGTDPSMVDFDAYVVLNDAIIDVLENYKTAKCANTITDIVYLVNSDYPLYPEKRIQPQIVPIFAFDNEILP